MPVPGFLASASPWLRGKPHVLSGLPPLCPLFALFSTLAPFVFNSLQPLFCETPGWGVLLSVTSALDHPHGAETRDFAGQARALHYFDDRVDILVRFRDFFQDPIARVRAQENSLRFELFRFGAHVAPALRRGARERATRAMAHRAERFVHGALRAHQNVTGRAHRAGNQHRLASSAIRRRNKRRARGKGTRGALAMHQNIFFASAVRADTMALALG